MKKLFEKKEKKELTEEEQIALNERKEKIKATGVKVIKVVFGVAAFVAGMLIVAAAVDPDDKPIEVDATENNEPAESEGGLEESNNDMVEE